MKVGDIYGMRQVLSINNDRSVNTRCDGDYSPSCLKNAPTRPAVLINSTVCIKCRYTTSYNKSPRPRRTVKKLRETTMKPDRSLMLIALSAIQIEIAEVTDRMINTQSESKRKMYLAEVSNAVTRYNHIKGLLE